MGRFYWRIPADIIQRFFTGPVNTLSPSIEVVGGGPPIAGATIRLSFGGWSGTDPVSLSGTLIREPSTVLLETQTDLATYELMEADINATLVWQVLAEDSAGITLSEAIELSPISASAPIVQSNPTLSGTMGVGNVLSVNVGSATGIPEPTSQIQMQMADTEIGTYSNISGATNETFLQTVDEAGKWLRVQVTWSNGELPNAIAYSAAQQVPTVESPYAELILPGPDYVAGTAIAVEVDWQQSTGILWAAIYNGDTQIGSRTSFDQTDHESTINLTPNAADTDWNVRVYNAETDGTLVWQSSNFIVLASTAAITIGTTLQTEYAPSSVVALSGTYAGAWSGTGTIQVYDSLDAPVGSATNITNVLNGSWGPTNITLPADEDTGYYVKAIHADTVTEIDSAAFDISAASASTLQTFAFEAFGTSDDDDVAFFGTAFPQGVVQPEDDLLVRSVNGNTERRTQWAPVALWDDGSVLSARLAVELPAVTDATRHSVLLRLGETHSSPGATLDLETVLTGRTAAIEIYEPGGSSPVHTIDPLDLITEHRWMEGPLVLSGRVEVRVGGGEDDIPAAAVGNVESVRCCIDWYVTKDGFLELSVCWRNDRLPFTSVDQTGGGYAICGDAAFGYMIKIDGVTLYDQRWGVGTPQSVLKHYCAWRRRVGRDAGGRALGTTIHSGMLLRPVHIPDAHALYATEVERPWQDWIALRTGVTGPIDNAVNNSVGKETDPNWNYDINRAAGAVGGRPELGHRTAASVAWLVQGYRNAIRLAYRHVEAAALRETHWYDWEDNLWIVPQNWPQFTRADSSPNTPGTSKFLARSTSQRPHNDFTNYITSDLAHQGAFFTLPALLTGDPWLYEEMLAQVSWDQLVISTRWNGASELYSTTPSYRGMTPSPTTGIALAPVMGGGGNQTRTISWGIRDLSDAALLCPDSYAGKTDIKNLIKGWMAGLAAQAPLFEGVHGTEIGLPIVHSLSTGGRQSPTYQNNMAVQSVVKILRTGIGGPSALTWAEKFLKWMVSWIDEPNDGLHRFHMRGSSKAFSPDSATPGTAQSWDDVATKSDAWLGFPNSAWTVNMGERAYNADGVACLVPIRDLDGIISPLLIRQALDAAVRLWSERASSNVGDVQPEQTPEYFVSTNVANNNGVASLDGVYPDTREAPQIVSGQSFTFAADAQDGDFIGRVKTTGALPRNSAAGFATADAFVIDDQPVNDPIGITPGGMLYIASAADLPAEPFNIDVYCRTFEQLSTGDTPVEHRSSTATLTISPIAITPILAAAGPFNVPVNAGTGVVVHTPTYTNTPTQPVTLTIESGNTGSYFAIDGATIETTANLAGASPPVQRSLVVRATNSGGFDEETYVFDIVAAGTAPVIANQTVAVSEGAAINTSVEIVNTGDPTTTITIDSGDSGGKWADDSPDAIKVAGAIARAETEQFVLGITGANINGNDTATITVDVEQADWVFALGNSTTILFAASAARRLRDDYTGMAMRVKRLSDNAQRDLQFDSGTGELDTSDTFDISTGESLSESLAAWVGSGDATALAFDQSAMAQGLATEATAGAPYIMQSGTLCTRGGKPAFRFTGGRGMTWSSFRTGGTAEMATIVPAHRNAAAQTDATIWAIAVNDATSAAASVQTSYIHGRIGSFNRTRLVSNGATTVAFSGTDSFTDGSFKVLTGTRLNQTNRKRAVGVNGTFSNATDGSDWTAMNSTAYATFGHRALGGPLGWEGDIPEIIVTAKCELSTDEPTVRGNQATYYGV